MIRILSLVLILSFVSVACVPYGPAGRQPNNDGSPSGIRKQDVGTIAGAVGGAFLGANVGKGHGRTLGIAAGTILGGMLGNEIGASLDRADIAYYNKTQQNALELVSDNVPSRWVNPDSGNSGVVTPVKTYKTPAGNYCREFTQTIQIGNKQEEGYGTACRQPDGSWKIVN